MYQSNFSFTSILHSVKQKCDGGKGLRTRPLVQTLHKHIPVNIKILTCIALQHFYLCPRDILTGMFSDNNLCILAELCKCFNGSTSLMLKSGLTRSLIAKLLQCSPLSVCEFHIASEEHHKRGYRRVCSKVCCQMLHLKRIRMIAAMCMSSADLPSVNRVSYRILSWGGKTG